MTFDQFLQMLKGNPGKRHKQHGSKPYDPKTEGLWPKVNPASSSLSSPTRAVPEPASGTRSENQSSVGRPA